MILIAPSEHHALPDVQGGWDWVLDHAVLTVLLVLLVLLAIMGVRACVDIIRARVRRG